MAQDAQIKSLEAHIAEGWETEGSGDEGEGEEEEEVGKLGTSGRGCSGILARCWWGP